MSAYLFASSGVSLVVALFNALVEELVAQLTLLRFAGLGSPAASRVERSHIEELLLRIEALTDASQSADTATARA